MSTTGIIMMLVFAAVGFAVLNRGMFDKKYKRNEAYWNKF